MALALVAGLGGQWALDRRPVPTWAWAPLLGGAAVFALLARHDVVERSRDPSGVARAPRAVLLALALGLGALAFPGFTGNRFRLLPTLGWLGSLAAFYLAFHPPREAASAHGRRWPVVVLAQRGVHLSWHTLALLGILLVGAVLRLYQLDAIPSEMGTDMPLIYENAREIMQGQLMIFCPRYPGRESLYFYLLATYGRLFGLDFFGIKFTSALIGLSTILALYGLGRYLFDREVGLVAAAFLAASKWHVILSRSGYRAALMPLAVAATIYLLVRAVRRGRSSDFALAGMVVGLGMYTYNAYLIVPAIVCAALAAEFALLGRAALRRCAWGLVALALGAALVYLPLARYALEEPQLYLFRVATRVTSVETPLPADPLRVLAGNLWHTAGMFNLRGDIVFYNNVPGQRQLGAVSAVLFVFGLAWGVARWRQRHNATLLIFLGGLLLPTALSVAFPQEVPNAVRASGALIPAFLLIALPLRLLHRRLVGAWQGSSRHLVRVPVALALLLLLGVELGETRGAYFQDFVQHLPGCNYPISLELARALDGFAAEGAAYIKAWPHWYDGNALRVQMQRTPQAADWEVHELHPARPPLSTASGRLLFIVNPQDGEALRALRAAFPCGIAISHRDHCGAVAYITFYGER
jgi:4-amino-4-deoxy-L-arabinose transferase-like glycosyltransferase